MRVLLDTHIFLWFIESDTRLSASARQMIMDNETDVHLSIVSVWEMAIKASIGKLKIPSTIDIFIPQQSRDNDMMLLNITIDDIARLTTLPFHHRDPFDRLLIAQAMVEQLPILSADNVFEVYDVDCIW